jgi:hypothetical protein
MSFPEIYFDWDGRPINAERWTELQQEEKHVAVTDVSGLRVSTVWIGLNSNVSGPPLIFETMIFAEGWDCPLSYCQRYSDKESAAAGHQYIVELLQAIEESGFTIVKGPFDPPCGSA